MTPGVTQMMAMHAANQLDTVESVRVSHGSYRPIAFSASITEQRHMNMIHIYHRVQCMKIVNLNKYFRLRVREK